jgi:hypothetical protein
MNAKRIVVGIIVAVLNGSPLFAQTFSSGSTGADGALDASAWGSNSVITLQLPESGIFNFTTINIPSGRTLQFFLNSSNTPAVLLAQGNVTIAGTVSVSARNEGPNTNRTPGPGGFLGGFPAGNGFGPGAGQISGGGGPIGRWVGPLTLVPIVGGSGGAGVSIVQFCQLGQNGGGGGGAIVIASSGSISLTGGIFAIGNFACGGYGAGGAIRLVANAVNVSGGSLQARGNSGNDGVIRIEAPQGALSFSGSSTPAAVLSTPNPTIVPVVAPVLTLTSIGGFPIPVGSGARADTVDLLLPTQFVDPIPLVVHASNVPVGSQVTLAINGSEGATATPGTLTGTDLSSTATLNVSGLNRTKVIFLFASVTFDVPNLAQAGNAAGPDQIAKLRVDTELGKESRIAFLRRDGTEVALSRVPANIRQIYGR